MRQAYSIYKSSTLSNNKQLRIIIPNNLTDSAVFAFIC